MEESEETGDNMEAAAPVDSVESEHEAQRQVPLEALEAERAQRQGVQDELRMIKENMSLMQSQLGRPQGQEEVESLQDDDVLTVGEAKKFIGNMNKEYKSSLDEIKMSQRHPDYSQVVTKYLPEVIKQNPGLKNTLMQTQDYELAYYLAKNSDAYKKTNKKEKIHADAERIVQNSSRSGSLSSVGQNSPISEAKRWKDMSEDDFRSAVNKNLGYF